MAKLAQSTIKYLIEATFQADGVVEKPDVIGAVFGQTEGLLGSELDLRELQRTGRIGRIDVKTSTSKGKTNGIIEIPSSLDGSETALIAAAVETIERIGPCDSKIKIKTVKDIRSLKRDYVVDRAKRILKRMMDEEMPDTNKLTDNIKKSVRAAEIVNYKNLAAGPDVEKSEEVIVVEGRADVVNLLKNGIKNAVAMGGATISSHIVDLCKKKTTTFFLDGDRGGDLILKELQQVAEIRAVARAPRGKEVEDLDSEEILSALKRKKSIEDLTKLKVKKRKVKRKQVAVPNKIKKLTPELKGTLEAVLLDEKLNQLNRIPVSDLCDVTEKTDNVSKIVFDGVITQRLVDIASEKKVTTIIGDRISEIAKRPIDIQLLTFSDIEK